MISIHLIALVVCSFALAGDTASESPATQPASGPESRAGVAPALEAGFSSSGLTGLRYAGRTLLNAQAHPEDGFRVADYVRIARDGRRTRVTSAGGGYLVEWDGKRHALSWRYDWGAVRCEYVVAGERLGLRIVVSNTSKNDTIAGVNVFPFALRFARDPNGFNASPQMEFLTGAPTVIHADDGATTVFVANPQFDRKLYVGLQTNSDTVATHRYEMRVGSTPLPSDPASWEKFEHAIKPGASDAYEIIVQFGRSGARKAEVLGDLFERFIAGHLSTLNWADRRPIGQLVLASAHAAKGASTNPRGWFDDPKLDIGSDFGKANFHHRLGEYADRAIDVCRRVGCQGVIVWDVEGQEFEHPTSYAGDPTQLEKLAPEMHLEADRFFKSFRDAGLRVGVTVRPQNLITTKKPPVQERSADPAGALIEKIAYARRRWNCTLFYVDSNVDARGAPMDAAVFEKVARAHPDVLLIPELENGAYYRSTAPYDEARLSVTGTPASVRDFYPKAFSVLNLAEGRVADFEDVLRESVRGGDVLLLRAWYDSEEAALVKRVYREAAAEPSSRPATSRAATRE